MKPFFVLIITFLLVLSGTLIFTGNVNYVLSGKIGLAVMLFFTSIGHFKFTKGMEMMLPDFVPQKKFVILATGFIEIAAAIGVLIPHIQKLTGILLIIFLILILPTNIYASLQNVNYETGKKDGKGLSYLWFRVPFQILLIVWTWYFVTCK